MTFRLPKAGAEAGYFDREIAVLTLLRGYTEIGIPVRARTWIW